VAATAVRRNAASLQDSARAHNRLVLVLSFLGLYVSGVLWLGHLLNASLPCGGSSGCEIVASDPSSVLLGIPVAAYGFVAYALIAVTAVLRGLGRAPPWVAVAGLGFAGTGAAISLAFTWHAETALGASCLWCMASAAIMTVLFVAHLALCRLRKVTGEGRKSDLVVAAVLAALSITALGITARTSLTASKLRINLAAFSAMPYGQLVPADAHRLGRPRAAVTIVEFGDLACPSCKLMHLRLMKFLPLHPSVCLVFRHYPLSSLGGHENAFRAALLAEQAGPAAFWLTVGKFYAVKGELSNAAFAGISPTVPLVVNEGTAKTRIDADIAVANRLGIEQTPTYLVLAPHARVAATVSDLVEKLSEPQIAPYVLGGKRS
jgi:uncharacterized membrane protein/protein-disulfide isomerase